MRFSRLQHNLFQKIVNYVKVFGNRLNNGNISSKTARPWLQNRLRIFLSKPYSTATCDMTVTHDVSVVGLVRMFVLNAKHKPYPNP